MFSQVVERERGFGNTVEVANSSVGHGRSISNPIVFLNMATPFHVLLERIGHAKNMADILDGFLSTHLLSFVFFSRLNECPCCTCPTILEAHSSSLLHRSSGFVQTPPRSSSPSTSSLFPLLVYSITSIVCSDDSHCLDSKKCCMPSVKMCSGELWVVVSKSYRANDMLGIVGGVINLRVTIT